MQLSYCQVLEDGVADLRDPTKVTRIREGPYGDPRGEPRSQIELPLEDDGRVLFAEFRRDPEASQVALVDGKVVGFMLGEIRSGEFGLEEPTGWIEVLGVDPDVRGQAIGRRLAEKMLDHFKSQGAATVRTLVDETMPEIGAFFTALGFESAGPRPFVKTL